MNALAELFAAVHAAVVENWPEHLPVRIEIHLYDGQQPICLPVPAATRSSAKTKAGFIPNDAAQNEETDERGKLPDPARDIESRHRGSPFSPLERTIMRAATDQWQTAAIFADKTGQKCNHSFYAIMANLVDRHWLEGGRNGYRLPPDTDLSLLS